MIAARRLQELLPAHQAREKWFGRRGLNMRGKMGLDLIMQTGAICLWACVLSIYYRGLFVQRLLCSETDSALVKFAREHDTVCSTQQLNVHGPFNGIMQKTWSDIPVHAAVQIDLRRWAYGSLDSETLKIHVDSYKVLEEELSYNMDSCRHSLHTDKLDEAAGTASEDWNYGCFAVVSSTVPHSSSTLTFR